MLQQPPTSPSLGAASNFHIPVYHVPGGPSLEAEKRIRLRALPIRLPGFHRHMEMGQRGLQALVHFLVELLRIETMDRAAEAIGQLVIVHDCSTSTGTPHNRAVATCWMLVSVKQGLEVTQREGGVLPLVKPQRGDSIGCRFEQRLVDRHVPAALGRGVNNQPNRAARFDQFAFHFITV